MVGGIGVNNNLQIPHHALRPLGGVHDVDGLHTNNNNNNNNNHYNGTMDHEQGSQLPLYASFLSFKDVFIPYLLIHFC